MDDSARQTFQQQRPTGLQKLEAKRRQRKDANNAASNQQQEAAMKPPPPQRLAADPSVRTSTAAQAEPSANTSSSTPTRAAASTSEVANDDAATGRPAEPDVDELVLKEYELMHEKLQREKEQMQRDLKRKTELELSRQQVRNAVESLEKQIALLQDELRDQKDKLRADEAEFESVAQSIRTKQRLMVQRKAALDL